MLQVKYIHFSPRCRKSHIKQQIQYELTYFNPFLVTRCLHVANDFRVYSQLSLPICRLSAYTLCIKPILKRRLTFKSIKRFYIIYLCKTCQGQLLEGVECHVYLYCFTFDDITLNRAFVIIVLFPKPEDQWSCKRSPDILAY